MSRPNWNETFMDMCEVLAKRSTCLRLQTASIIVKNNVIISIGYNGVCSGEQHCCDYWKENFGQEFIQSSEFYDQHHLWSVDRELHAEMNAILQAGKHGIALNESKLYTIYSPCIQCAKTILMSGIRQVYYKKLYKRNTVGIKFLNERGVECIEI